MFGLLFSPLRALWNDLKKPLSAQLKGQSRKLIGKFKGLLKSTMNDLINTISDRFVSTKACKSWSYDQISPNQGGQVTLPLISFHSFPIDRLSSDADLVNGLLQKLKMNKDLQGFHNSIGMNDAEWDEVLTKYTKDFVRYGVSYALKQMVQNDTPIWGRYVVLSIAEGEAYDVNGNTQNFDMAKVFLPPTPNSKDPSLKEARKIWDDRQNSKYRYERGKYTDTP